MKVSRPNKTTTGANAGTEAVWSCALSSRQVVRGRSTDAAGLPIVLLVVLDAETMTHIDEAEQVEDRDDGRMVRPRQTPEDEYYGV